MGKKKVTIDERIRLLQARKDRITKKEELKKRIESARKELKALH
jgi:hypothetical protein